MGEIVELFVEADVDGSGSLSWYEFQEFVQDERIKAFFMALELDMSALSTIFQLLDTSGDGKLEALEFVEGCIKLRGGARKVDVTILHNENSIVMEKLESLEQSLKSLSRGQSTQAMHDAWEAGSERKACE